MARGMATCTCKTCGKSFVKINPNCRNSQAARDWEAWAVENIILCPDCYREAKKAEQAETAKGFNLPELTGKSEKQISYAADVRARFVAEHKDLMSQMAEMLSSSKLADECAKNGMTVDGLKDMLSKDRTSKGKVYKVLTVADAGKLLDSLL